MLVISCSHKVKQVILIFFLFFKSFIVAHYTYIPSCYLSSKLNSTVASLAQVQCLQLEAVNSKWSASIPGIFLVSVLVHWFFELNLITVCKFYFH